MHGYLYSHGTYTTIDHTFAYGINASGQITGWDYGLDHIQGFLATPNGQGTAIDGGKAVDTFVFKSNAVDTLVVESNKVAAHLDPSEFAMADAQVLALDIAHEVTSDAVNVALTHWHGDFHLV